MPILANAKKAQRVSARKTVINQVVKSRLKTALDTFKTEPSKKGLASVYSMIDRAVKGNIIQANKAARLKQGMSKLAAK